MTDAFPASRCRPLKLAFVLDPLAGLKAYKDSSVAMMRAAARKRPCSIRHRLRQFELAAL